EFPAVAIVGVEDGLLPHERAQREAEGDGIEEERRLCFVGMTRAMRALYLIHARYRTVFGQTTPTIASRFLGELPQDAIELVEPEPDDDEPFDYPASPKRPERFASYRRRRRR